jgi:hypothetical protein
MGLRQEQVRGAHISTPALEATLGLRKHMVDAQLFYLGTRISQRLRRCKKQRPDFT